MSLVGDLASELAERLVDLSLGRWAPRWARWLAVGALFIVVLALPSPPAWLEVVADIAWASLAFSFTLGLVFGTYARKLGDEGHGSRGFFIFSMLLYVVAAVWLPSMTRPSDQPGFTAPSPGYLLGLVLAVVDGVWVFARRAAPGHAPAALETWGAWSVRATALGLGAGVSLAAAVIAGAPFFLPHRAEANLRWYPAWGAAFCAWGLVVSLLQAADVRAGTVKDETSGPKQAIAVLLLGGLFLLIPAAVWVRQAS